MGGLLHFSDIFIFLLIVLMLLGSGRFLDIAQRLERMDSDLRAEWNSFRAALFPAKCAGSSVDSEAEGARSDEEARQSRTWARMLLAFLLGNLTYFVSSPFLPPAVVLNAERFPALPIFADIWFCLLAFGVLSMVRTFKLRRN